MEKSIAAKLFLLFLVSIMITLPACTSDNDYHEDPSRVGFFNTTWPFGSADRWRTRTARDNAGLPADLSRGSFVTSSIELPSVPFWGITYSEDAIFVLGGSPYALKYFTDAMSEKEMGQYTPEVGESYVAKINPNTMESEILYLDQRSTVNYIGNILAHEDGFLYVVATARLYKIDPTNFTVIRTLDLPVIDTAPDATCYNGLQLSPVNGDIILKANNFTDPSVKGKMVVVNTETFSTTTIVEVEIGTGRMTLAETKGIPFVYLPSPTETNRFQITDNEFILDEAWSQPYREEDEDNEQAAAIGYLGDYYNMIIFQNNNLIGINTNQPIELYNQSTIDLDAPLVTQRSNSTNEVGGEWFGANFEPFNSGMVAVADQVNYVIAGWQASPDNTLERKWEVFDCRTSAGAAMASEQGHMYTDDRVCETPGENCTLYMVVLDVLTGEELGRIEVAGTEPSMGQIFVSENSVFFIATEAHEPNGYLTKVSFTLQ